MWEGVSLACQMHFWDGVTIRSQEIENGEDRLQRAHDYLPKVYYADKDVTGEVGFYNYGTVHQFVHYVRKTRDDISPEEDEGLSTTVLTPSQPDETLLPSEQLAYLPEATSTPSSAEAGKPPHSGPEIGKAGQKSKKKLLERLFQHSK